ncbi:MAG TPA: ABC transporter permease [Thermoanaerobaculia bacterium]|nr:ABC transporter permease [Thermoanaerobaculia bacterium]
MIQALRQAARSLALRPGFSLLIILIIALCIGGNASIFSAAQAVLFKNLMYKDVDRLVILNATEVSDGGDTDVSWIEARDWQERTQRIEELSPFLPWQSRLVVQKDSTERIGVNFTGPSYLALLGVRPQLGRLFTPEENGAPGSAPAIILSHDLWQRLYAKDPGIIGRKIQLNTTPYTVVGVMPEGFYDITQSRWPIDAWIPAVQAAEAFRPGTPLFEGRDQRVWFILARLKPGVSQEQAQEEIATVAKALQREFPETNEEYGARIYPVREFMFEDLLGGMEVLLAGAVLVLLIGCANIANLLLTRTAERGRELSLRLALGANRLRLAQYVLAESLILALAGGALGILLAAWGSRLMAGLLALPGYTRIELDANVLGVAFLATLLTGFLFALPPAISVVKMDSKGTLQQIRAAGGRTHSAKGRNGLIVFQVAIVVVLLIVAGLLLRSFRELQTTGVDFNTERLLTLRMSFGTERYQERPNISTALTEMVRHVQEIPGVEGAGTWGPGMPGIETQFTSLQREGAPADEPTVRSDMHSISPGALKLLGVTLLKGREFTPQDTTDAPRVVMVSKSLADLLWPGQDPIGKRIIRPTREPDVYLTVVGLVPNTRFQGRDTVGNHHLLFPSGQLPTVDTNLLVRTSATAGDVANSLRQAIRQVDPQLPVYDLQPLEHRMWEEETLQRLNAAVAVLYASLALILALLGLYSMLSYSVVQRTQEIGLRMALGADRGGVLGMMMSRGLLLVGGGLALGLAGSLVLTRLLSTQLYGVTARDPLTFLGVVLVFSLVAALATYLPARRATKVEPTIALRYE